MRPRESAAVGFASSRRLSQLLSILAKKRCVRGGNRDPDCLKSAAQNAGMSEMYEATVLRASRCTVRQPSLLMDQDRTDPDEVHAPGTLTPDRALVAAGALSCHCCGAPARWRAWGNAWIAACAEHAPENDNA